MTTWGVYEGGGQERELAEQYKRWVAAVQARWPRPARILRAIAKAYERQAIGEDEDAEIDQDFD